MKKFEYPEIESRMEKAHAWWQDKDIGKAEFYEALTPMTRKAVAVGHLNYQVHNGGFAQWHFNRYAACGAAPIKALCTEMGTETAKKVASLVAEAVATCDRNDRNSTRSMWDMDDEEGPRYESTNEFDEAYYAISDQFLAEVEAWLAKNQNNGAP